MPDKLYHGTLYTLTEIDLRAGRGYKDFGKRFYLAIKKEQAIGMMNKKYRPHQYDIVIGSTADDDTTCCMNNYREGLQNDLTATVTATTETNRDTQKKGAKKRINNGPIVLSPRG